MNLQLPSVEEMERIAAHANENVELAAYVTTFQTLEHFYYEFVQLDSVNFRVMPENIMTVLGRPSVVDESVIHPIPNDYMQQMLNYSFNAIRKILMNPSKKMVKETVMGPANKLKKPTIKTMNWIAKRPGRNIREKIGSKNKVLMERNKYSLQTPENAVTLRVIKEMQRLINSRIDYRASLGKFDDNGADLEKLNVLREFSKLASRIRHSNFSEVQLVPVTKPNNKLMGHKDYSIIWKSYTSLMARKHLMATSWQHLLPKTVTMVQLFLAQQFANMQYSKLVDEFFQLKDEGNQFFSTQTSEGAIRIIQERYVKGHIVKMDDFGKVLISLPTKKLVSFNANAFPHLKNQLRVGLSYFVQVNQANDTMPINKIELNQEVLSFLIASYENELIVICEQLEDDVFVEKDQHVFHFEFDESRFEEDKGIPLMVTFPDGQQGNYFTDYQGIHHVKQSVMEWISSAYTLPPFERHTKHDEIENEQEIMAIDGTFTQPYIVADRYKQKSINPYIVEMVSDGRSIICHPDKNAIYDENTKWFNYSMMLNQSGKSPEYLAHYMNLIRKMKRQLKLGEQEWVLYLVPDSIEEWAQKDIKQTMNSQFKNTMPVWRSVAAGIALQIKDRLEQQHEVIVFDFNSATVTVTPLSYVQTEKGPLYIHFPAFELEEVEQIWTKQYILTYYIETYQKQYGVQLSAAELNNIIQNGMLEKVVYDKETIQLFNKEENAYKSLFYDQDIINRLKSRQRKDVQKLVQQLGTTMSEIGYKKKSDYLLILSDFNFDDEVAKTIKTSVGAMKLRQYPNKFLVKAMTHDKVKETVVAGEPLWREFLPNLSLEVVENGHFSQLSLIKDSHADGVLGKVTVFHVDQPFILTAGARFDHYVFPLIRGGHGLHKAEYKAFIKHPAFPLKKDVQTNLRIEYQYGIENSYRLFLKAMDGDAPFDEIEVEWQQEENSEDAVYTTAYLHMPPEPELESLLERFESVFSRFEADYQREYNQSRHLESVSMLVKKHMYAIKRLARINSYSLLMYIDNFYKSSVYEKLISIEENTAPFLRQNEAERRKINFIKRDAQQFLCAFGRYMHPNDYKKMIEKFESLDDRVKYALVFQHSREDIILKFIQKQVKKDCKNVIRSIRHSLWHDEKILVNFFNFDEAIVYSLISEIKNKMRKWSKLDKLSEEDLKVYKDYSEVLLAILQLRELPNFTALRSTDPQTHKLARHIRMIDAICFENGYKQKVFLEFSTNKPSNLRNMADLAYALNEYLIGGENMNLVEVKDIAIE